MKVAIIGMGVAGTSVLREWTKAQKLNPSIEITVFTDKKTFGRGKAFQQDDPRLLMNQSAKFTSVKPDNHRDFVEWIKMRHNDEQPEDKFYPRAEFGAYVAERMNEWLAESKATVIYDKVESIRIVDQHYRLTWAHQTADFDAVHLCTGTFPYKDPYDLNDHPHTIADPFPMQEKLVKLPQGATIGVIGMGLTSIDVFRYTHAHRPDINVAFFSRSGTFKTLISDIDSIENQYITRENIEQEKAKHNGLIPLATYLDWFKKELTYLKLSLDEPLTAESLGSKQSIKRQLAHQSEIDIIQVVLKNITLLQTDIWSTLTEADKHLFIDKYYKAWDKLRAPFPPETGEDLFKAWDENVFQVYDNLVQVTKNESSFTFELDNDETIKVDYVINATGNDINVTYDMEEVPLISQLVNERIIQAETFGGIQVTVPTLSVVSQKYGVLNTLKAHGQLIAGIQFGNSSVRIISKSARASVEDIVNQLENKVSSDVL
ncbi:MAG TPA: FAD/NAD(P)-binding protein [Pseudogracilibacillus sp.]|nr:FAD/NAD(P)-binding protein [Pseudogracilibacillus sp.]